MGNINDIRRRLEAGEKHSIVESEYYGEATKFLTFSGDSSIFLLPVQYRELKHLIKPHKAV